MLLAEHPYEKICYHRWMLPTRQLPSNYQSVGTFDVKRSRLTLVFLNLAGLILLVPFYAMFAYAARMLNPSMTAPTTVVLGGKGWLGALVLFASVVVINVVVVIAHEGVHGIFFWLLTHERPKFAFRGLYASAATPGWYLPRLPYLWVGMSPLVVLSLAGVVLMPWLSSVWLLALVGFLTFNAAGAVGDLVICAWVLTHPTDCYVSDAGDSVTLYSVNPKRSNEHQEA
jgi:hypothetical protein